MNIELGVNDEAISKLSSMPEKKSSQMLKLGNSIVWEAGCLISFFSKDSNSNVCALNHIHIICSIPYAQRDSILFMLLYEFNYFCLLCWRKSVGNSWLCLAEHFMERSWNLFVSKDSRDLAARYHEAIVLNNSCLIYDFIQFILQVFFMFIELVNREVFSVKQTTRISNFQSSFSFISS